MPRIFSEAAGIQSIKPEADFEKLLEHIRAMFGDSVSLSVILPEVVKFLLQSKDFRGSKIDRASYIEQALDYLRTRGLHVDMDLKKAVSPEVARKITKEFREKVSGWSSRHTYEILLRLLKDNGISAYLRNSGGKWYISFSEGRRNQRREKEEEEGFKISVDIYLKKLEELRSFGEAIRKRDFAGHRKEEEFFSPPPRVKVKEVELKSEKVGRIEMPAIRRRPRR